MSAESSPPVRCTGWMGETEAALAKRNGPPVCRHGEMLVQAEKTMSYERRWCVTGGGRWWVCPVGDHGCGSMLEPGSASRDLSSRREPSLSPIDLKLSDCGAWRGLCRSVEKWRWSLAQAVTRGAVRCSAWLGPLNDRDRELIKAKAHANAMEWCRRPCLFLRVLPDGSIVPFVHGQR